MIEIIRYRDIYKHVDDILEDPLIFIYEYLINKGFQLNTEFLNIHESNKSYEAYNSFIPTVKSGYEHFANERVLTMDELLNEMFKNSNINVKHFFIDYCDKLNPIILGIDYELK